MIVSSVCQASTCQSRLLQNHTCTAASATQQVLLTYQVHDWEHSITAAPKNLKQLPAAYALYHMLKSAQQTL